MNIEKLKARGLHNLKERELLEVGKSFLEEGNFSQARTWLAQAKERGSLEADYYLGWIHEKEEEPSMALPLYQSAAKAGFPKAKVRLGLFALEEGKQGEGRRLLEEAGKQDLPEAWGYLGLAYFKGWLGETDCLKAIDCWEKAALLEDASSMVNLGLLYHFGADKAAADESRSLEWFEQAAALGNHQAFLWIKDKDLDIKGKYYLALAYEKQKNFSECVQLLRFCAEAGEAMAQNRLGHFFTWGLGGLNKSPEAARMWYEKAALGGNAQAQFNLGECFEYGKGTPKNREKAKLWYEKAARGGNAFAKDKLELWDL